MLRPFQFFTEGLSGKTIRPSHMPGTSTEAKSRCAGNGNHAEAKVWRSYYWRLHAMAYWTWGRLEKFKGTLHKILSARLSIDNHSLNSLYLYYLGFSSIDLFNTSCPIWVHFQSLRSTTSSSLSFLLLMACIYFASCVCRSIRRLVTTDSTRFRYSSFESILPQVAEEAFEAYREKNRDTDSLAQVFQISSDLVNSRLLISQVCTCSTLEPVEIFEVLIDVVISFWRNSTSLSKCYLMVATGSAPIHMTNCGNRTDKEWVLCSRHDLSLLTPVRCKNKHSCFSQHKEVQPV